MKCMFTNSLEIPIQECIFLLLSMCCNWSAFSFAFVNLFILFNGSSNHNCDGCDWKHSILEIWYWLLCLEMCGTA